MAEEANVAPKISIQAQYVRDMSFENVAVQKGDGRLDAKPDIQVGVNLDAKKRTDNQFEVILKVNATAKSDDAVMFIVELEYAGIFRVENVPEQQLHPVLLIECPRILFPFARRIVADATRDGGYPPLLLDMVDFAGIYTAEVKRRQEAAAAEKAEGVTEN
ncbi:MAG: protein-export chaperone SecB [Paracoccaceae bacterium]|jgi:preprotein translocase subunit SecB|nr:protein-export chaperone SecB [Paracoccaceae bacterium]MDG1369208.1 protein-export chaperone SecB [Paracoccaceae bacterium]